MYDQFASDYDRFVNWQNRLDFELPFLTRMLEDLPTLEGERIKVLDAACGTGMHTLALARAGYEAAGADLSAEMIAHARQNAREAECSVRFEAAGFGGLAAVFGREGFNAIVCLGNSLPHLLTRTHLSAALSDFSACLKNGGLLLIQNRNFDAVMAKRERWMEPQEHREGQHQWIFQRFYDFNADGTLQFTIVSLKREGETGWQSEIHSTTLCPQLKTDLVEALKAAGFDRIQTFGSLKGEPFDELASGNLVLSTRKMIDKK